MDRQGISIGEAFPTTTPIRGSSRRLCGVTVESPMHGSFVSQRLAAVVVTASAPCASLIL